MKIVVVKMMPLMRVMTRGLFRGVWSILWTLWQRTVPRQDNGAPLVFSFWCSLLWWWMVPPLLCPPWSIPPWWQWWGGGDCGVEIVSAVDDPSEPDPAQAFFHHPSNVPRVTPCYRHCPPPLMHLHTPCCIADHLSSSLDHWPEYLLTPSIRGVRYPSSGDPLSCCHHPNFS